MRIKTELIDNYLLLNKLTKTQFCKICGISYTSLQNVYKQNLVVILLLFSKLLK